MFEYAQLASAVQGDLPMSFYHILGVAAGALAFVEFYLYILAIFQRDWRFRSIRDRAKPNRATWFIWTALGIMTVLTYEASGATDTVWFPLVYAVGFGLVAFFSIWRGEFYKDEKGWKRFFNTTDIVCVVGAAVAIIIWKLFGNAELALLLAIGLDALGAWPTIKKSALRPRGENRLAWTVTLVAATFNFLAINWGTATFSIWAYPFYMLVANGLIAGLLYRKSRVMMLHAAVKARRAL